MGTSTVRSAIVFGLLGVALVALLGRVAYLQTAGRDEGLARAQRQQHQNSVIQARRGSIYDANGILMAGTVQTHSLFVDPKFMQDVYQSEGRSLVEMDDDIARLASVIDRDPFEISQLLGDRADRRYVKLADHLGPDLCRQIDKLDLPGVGLLPSNVRYYPMGSIAAHLLGGSGREGKGLEGLELKFEKLLAGEHGRVRELKDARRRAIFVAADDYVAPRHGQHLVLTIDANIQMIAEQELAATCQQWRAKRGEAIVIDPRSGDVLAMANWPSFNPQNLDDSSTDIRRNRCLTDPYEPGSTIKPFLVGPALSWGATRPSEVWPIHGPTWVTRYGRRITDVHGYNSLATWDVLVKSSNIGMAMLGTRLGNQRLHEALSGFGFGRRTGIELPGEDPGLVNPLKRWTHYSTDSVSQGYELMVTPLQLARAFCAYANGGRLVRPNLLKGVLDADGNVVSRQDVSRTLMQAQVIDEQTALTVRRILGDTVMRGTATKARSQVWNIFGKTGTAHIARGGSYNDSSYTSSFLAGAPIENPRIVVAFIIHEPDRDHAVRQGLSYYGGSVAAPGAGRLVERTLGYLQVPASPQLPAPPPQIASVLYNFDPKLYQPKKPKPTAKPQEARVSVHE